jgi:hypothetical protein
VLVLDAFLAQRQQDEIARLPIDALAVDDRVAPAPDDVDDGCLPDAVRTSWVKTIQSWIGVSGVVSPRYDRSRPWRVNVCGQSSSRTTIRPVICRSARSRSSRIASS